MTEKKNPDIQKEEKFVLHGKVTTPEHYVDGVSQLLLGFPLTKLLLHTVVSPAQSNEPEVRKAVASIVIPTTAAIELANLILGVCKQSEEHLRKAMDEDGVAKLKQLLSNIRAEVPAGFVTKE